MVSPNGFRSNEETAEDNKFMAGAEGLTDVTEVVMKEWTGLVEALRQAGVNVLAYDGKTLPDEVFPNNWFSTHSDGRLVLYPMKVPSRAQEVRQDVIDKVREDFSLTQPVFDLSHWRKSNVALEGTGSLVLDRPNKVAYVALSKRADRNLAELWARTMGYSLVPFRTQDRTGEEIYHTNVLLSVGQRFAVLCHDVVPDKKELDHLVNRLKSTGKVVVPITLEQMENFAGNCLELEGSVGSVLAMSAAGWDSLDFSQQSVLESCVDQVVQAPVPTIERIGGGSVRCMIAELFPASQQGSVKQPDSQQLCSLDSETNLLELVLVHEPGLEVDAVMPWTLEPMKVDECFNRAVMKAEHRNFVQLLRSRGSRVCHVRDLLAEISSQGDAVKRQLFDMVWGKEVVDRVGISNLHVDHLTTGYARGPLDFVVPPLMNLFFMRDPAFAVPGGWTVIARPQYPIRQMESQLLRAMFRLHPQLKEVKVFEGLVDDPDCTIEGGDVLVVDTNTVLVGVSQRTTERGADKLAEFLFAETPVTRVLKVFIPKQRAFMHLDTLFTFVDKGTVLTMPYFWSQPDIYADLARRANLLNERMGSEQRQSVEDWISEPPRIELLTKGQTTPKRYKNAMSGLMAEGIIEKALFVGGFEGSWPSPAAHVAHALTEQWNDAANVFCISPGTVVAYKWCTRTITHLQDNGVTVIELDSVELMKGRGGARCMTMPLRRHLSHER